MFDLVIVLILHVALLQLLGRRLPEEQGGATASRPRQASPTMGEETARRMIERAYPHSCSDAHDNGRSPSRER